MKKLSQKIVNVLRKKGLKISFAESCTGGLLSSSITSINNSSKVFTIGLVTYSNQSKINALKVPKKTIRKHGAVSYETCLSNSSMFSYGLFWNFKCIYFGLI
jgi:PncC family amidohydrolase